MESLGVMKLVGLDSIQSRILGAIISLTSKQAEETLAGRVVCAIASSDQCSAGLRDKAHLGWYAHRFRNPWRSGTGDQRRTSRQRGAARLVGHRRKRKCKRTRLDGEPPRMGRRGGRRAANCLLATRRGNRTTAPAFAELDRARPVGKRTPNAECGWLRDRKAKLTRILLLIMVCILTTTH